MRNCGDWRRVLRRLPPCGRSERRAGVSSGTSEGYDRASRRFIRCISRLAVGSAAGRLCAGIYGRRRPLASPRRWRVGTGRRGGDRRFRRNSSWQVASLADGSGDVAAGFYLQGTEYAYDARTHQYQARNLPQPRTSDSGFAELRYFGALLRIFGCEADMRGVAGRLRHRDLGSDSSRTGACDN